jgi:hypothetical protein
MINVRCCRHVQFENLKVPAALAKIIGGFGLIESSLSGIDQRSSGTQPPSPTRSNSCNKSMSGLIDELGRITRLKQRLKQ